VVEMAWDELTSRVIAKMSDGYALQVGIVLPCFHGSGSGSNIFPQCGSGFMLAISVVDPHHPGADPDSDFYLRMRIRIQILASKYSKGSNH
jgi:hypothetical protein